MSIRNIQFLNLIISLLCLVFFFDLKFFLLSLLFYSLFLGLGINIGLHRGFSHGNLTGHPLLSKICLFFSVLCCMGKPRDWILIHRLHHQYSDTEADPHSPKFQGFFRVFFNQWSLPPKTPLRIVVTLKRSLEEQSEFDFFEKNYWLILVVYFLLLLALGGPRYWAYFGCLPATLALLATSLVNACCHSHLGNPKNVPWVSLLTLGEGHHFTHHLSPKIIFYNSWKAFDLSGLVFRLVAEVTHGTRKSNSKKSIELL